MQVSLTFEEFVRDLLVAGGVAEPSLSLYLQEENLEDFRLAFTHFSADKFENYELAEFIGDGILAGCLTMYIRSRFPNIQSVKWLTRLKHNLSNKKMLASIAMEWNFVPFIQYGEEMKAAMAEEPDLKNNYAYLSMLEDVVEATFGCILSITERLGKLPAVGYQICFNIVKLFLDPIEITLKYDAVFDGMTRLKELYEARGRGLKWPIRKENKGNCTPFSVDKLEDNRFSVTVYGWPLGDRTPIPQNRIKLATAIGKDLEVTRQEAASKALKVLDLTYHISEITPDPYQRNASTKKIVQK